MKKIYSLFAVIAMLTVALGFASCSNDDDKPQTIFYKMGFPKYNFDGATPSQMKQEMADIESPYKNALGVSDNSFTMTGTSSSCDKDVATKCKAAEATLSGRTFNSKFTFEVTNLNSNKVIYSFSN